MLSRRPARWFADRRSIAALEFALVAPLMLILLAGVYDISQAAIVYGEVSDAAEAMVASASSLAVQADNSTSLTYDQVQLIESTIWADVPSLRSGQQSGNPKSITMSSVFFYPDFQGSCVYGQSTPCQYVADIAWSVAYTGGADSGSTFQSELNPPPANCTNINGDPTIDQVAALTSLSGIDNVTKFRTLSLAELAASPQVSSTTFSTAPAYAVNEAGIAPILAVAIEFTYKPIFSLFLLRPYTFWVDGYWPVRSVKNITQSAPINLGSFSVQIAPLSNSFTQIAGTETLNSSGTAVTGYTLTGNDVNSQNVCVNTNISNPYATTITTGGP